jgi:neutral ceramidase
VRGEVSRSVPLALILLVVLLADPAQAQPCPDCLQAGAARVPLRVPTGTPLAGYGALARRLWLPDVLGRYAHAFWFRPSAGERDPLAARALVLEGEGGRLAWVAVDLVAVDRTFTADVERRLATAGLRPATLLISASHTHSGPGAFVDAEVMGWLALDRLDVDVREALLEAVVAAVRAADAGRRPARLARASVTAPPVARSRLEQPLDAELVAVRVTAADGAPLALLWNYAIHGTMLGPRNLRLSGDVTGEASHRLEQALGIPVLFVNGAVADVSPAQHGERATADVGAALAATAQAAWKRARPIARPRLATAARAVTLPDPRLTVRSCAGGWAPGWLTVPLGSLFARDATLTAVVVGDVGWVTFPGELQTRLGLAIKRAAGAHLGQALVAGLTNDYLGYFLTAADHARPGYVSCASLYGPAAGGCLADAAAGLLSALARGHAAATGPVACDR